MVKVMNTRATTAASFSIETSFKDFLKAGKLSCSCDFP